jgi:zinc protease
MREDQGGVYGVGVNGNINREPLNSYTINVSFTCAPENVEKLTGIVIDEAKKIKANGITPVNVEKVIAEDTRGLENAVKENSYWLYNLEQKYYYKEDPKIILEDPAMVKKLTVERTKELANKYFNESNFLQFVLMPEK